MGIDIILILTAGFALASVLGYLMQKLGLSPILGYLIAGFIIGPHSPGFVADLVVSDQLANIGVILMLFGVGLHFSLKDLIDVKNIAIPGAIGQTLLSASFTTWLVYYLGWSLESGIILGLATGVASTVVLIRVLHDNHLVQTIEGHIAIGWLIVEDILTVIFLLSLPLIADFFNGAQPGLSTVATMVGFMLLKFILLGLVMFMWGHKLVGFILSSVARIRSQELFTVTVVALIFLIATGSSMLFGTSIALGAFISGMVVGQTDVRHQAAANALPIKDVFAVFFFISVGMLFNPTSMTDNIYMFFGILFIILIVKPLAAFLIVILLRFPLKTAVIVALALAQIGEFSFILAKEALDLHLIPEHGFEILVACAVISISLNPLLFKLARFVQEKIKKRPALRHVKATIIKDFSGVMPRLFETFEPDLPKAIVVGFGSIGREAVRSLNELKFESIVIEENIDIVANLKKYNKEVIYGDASLAGILEAAGVLKAKILVITISDASKTSEIIRSANQLTDKIKILACIQSSADLDLMKNLRAEYVSGEVELSKGINAGILKIVRGRFTGMQKDSTIFSRI
jgi:CPA2 family monovalent cation:H+ antiporter-2